MMFNWFRQFSVASRLRGMALLAVVGVISVACALMWSSYQQQLADRQTAVRQAVEVAYSALQWVHARQQAGELDEAQAQRMAVAALDKLRYSGNEYFWVNDMSPRMVHHPIKPQLDGQDLSHMQDPNGVYLFKAFVDTVRAQGEGFVRYQWPKPGMAQPQDKVSYVKGFAPWGWVVGSGLYLDDVQAAFRAHVIKALGVVLITTLMLWGLIEMTARDLSAGVRVAVRRTEAIAVGEVRHKADGVAMASPQIAASKLDRGVGPIHTAMSELDQMTQQNAALVEESAAAAGSLKDQADALAQVVSRFRVAGAF